jgi:hypothetical protein
MSVDGVAHRAPAQEADRVEVRGNPTAEEVAAVLATLAGLTARNRGPSRYELWRRGRMAALRDSLADRR